MPRRRPPLRTALALAASLLASLLVGPLAGTTALAESMVTSLSTHQVTITSNYAGSQLVLFGAVQRDGQTIPRTTGYDVVVTVRGPKQFLTVREKEPVGPIWVNRGQQKFVSIPVYLGVFSSQPLLDITSPVLRARYHIGIEAFLNSPEIGLDRGAQDDPFREALGRIKQREGLFIERERGVAFLTDTIFRAAIPLPSGAPPGDYQVEVMLLADDILLHRTETNFELVKSGFEASVAGMAENQSVFYGLGTAAVALLFGWLASVVFRRD